MANGQHIGQNFFAGENISTVLSGVRGITDELAAGFARDPREREARRHLLAQQTQQKSAIRAERVKRLRTSLNDMIKQATAANKSNARLGSAAQRQVQAAAAALVALTQDFTEARTFVERFKAENNKPFPGAAAVEAETQRLAQAGQPAVSAGRAGQIATGIKPERPEPLRRVVSGDTPLGRELGLKPGQQAIVAFTLDPQGEVVKRDVRSRFGAPTQINILPGEPAFQKALGQQLGKQISGIAEAGQLAGRMEPSLRQMADLLAGGGVQTGALQPGITALQAIADDLGVDLAGLAARFDMDLGSLSEKQEFDRLATELITEGFQKFKGNLNQKEVELAIAAFAGLGRSEGANIKAIASGLAAQQVARERGTAALGVQTREEARTLQQEILAGGTTRFEELRETFEQQLQERFTQARGRDPTTALPPGVPEGSRLIGTTTEGKAVYETPEGTRLVVE